MPLAQIHNLRDTTQTCTMGEELERIGYKGETPASHIENPLSAHFELHIEQRRILQDTQRKIGVVTAIQGVRWYSVSIQGRRAHSGGMPMAQRADALVAASKVVLFMDSQARKHTAVATVGVLELERPSSNTVPGQSDFTIDLRHPSEQTLDEIEDALRLCIDGLVLETEGIEVEIERMWHSPAVQLDDRAVSCTRKAARCVVDEQEIMEMISLAGHDSALTSIRVPTSMVFVPSKDGISHAPEEFTTEEEW